MLTPDMRRIVEEQRLGFVATVAPDGTPNVSPKGTFIVLDTKTIAFGEIRSPATIRNLRANPRVEVNFVDPFARKGYRFAGTAMVTERGSADFDALLGHFRSALAPRMRAIVTIWVTKAQALTSPAYDDARTTEAELRRMWTARFRRSSPRRGLKNDLLQSVHQLPPSSAACLEFLCLEISCLRMASTISTEVPIPRATLQSVAANPTPPGAWPAKLQSARDRSTVAM